MGQIHADAGSRQGARGAFVIGGVLAGAFLLVGCSAGGENEDAPVTAPVGDAAWDQIVAAAEDEGQVVFYSFAPPTVLEAVEAAFEEAYPDIDLVVERIGGADLEPALESEHSTGAAGADVVQSVNYSWVRDKQSLQWLADLQGPDVEDDAWDDNGYLIDGQILITTPAVITIAWNTTLLPDGVSGYADLLDPKLADGAVGIADASSGMIDDYWAFVEEHEDEGYLEKLAAQAPAIFQSTVPLQEAMIAGEIAVGAFASSSDMAEQKQNGAPIDYVVPDPAWGAQNMLYALAGAAHPNAAAVFTNFIASPQGQFAMNEYGYSPLDGVREQTLGGGSEVVPTDIDRATDQDWAGEYTTRWRGIFG